MTAVLPTLDVETVEKLVIAASASPRHGLRNQLIVRLMYGHALRLVETVELTWGRLDMERGRLHITRCRSGEVAWRNLRADDLQALGRLREGSVRTGRDTPVFTSSSGRALTPDAVRKVITSAAEKAKIGEAVGPRLLRRSAGVRIGNVTRDVDAVKAFMGVSLRVSAVAVLPLSRSKKQADPWT